MITPTDPKVVQYYYQGNCTKKALRSLKVLVDRYLLISIDAVGHLLVLFGRPLLCLGDGCAVGLRAIGH
jgi:hypothetical protein